ncbi:hypothetical protein J4Q44_G00290320 [Coregonus suidteri]|uniref:Pyrin domain-containing protein n=1 Tax=Coregonus suidteri TaxID=861788 RepID=A0AAN8QDD3_9TELE
MDPSKEVSASEKERKPAGEESEEPFSKLLRTPSRLWSLFDEECRLLETEISRPEEELEVLKLLAKFNVDEQSATLPRTSSYRRLTPSEEECRDLEAEISRMKVKLEVLKRMLAVPVLLLTTLEEMNPNELRRFQSHLTRCQLFGFCLIPENQLEKADKQVTVDQMVKTYGPERAVEITLRILRGMKRVDLAEKLETDHIGTASTSHLSLFPPRPRSVLSPVWLSPISPLLSSSSSSFGSSKKLLSLTSAGSSGQLRSQEEAASEMERKPAGEESGELPSTSSGMLTLSEEECRRLETAISRLEDYLRFMKRMLAVPSLLLTTLEELTGEQLKTFQSKLTSVQLLGFPPIPESQLENADRQVIVGQMVKSYGPESALKITLRILRGMKRVDLAEKLETDHRGALLLTTLEELTGEQLKTFQSKLTSVQLPGFPPIPESQLENADRQVIVGQMVKTYGPERAVGKTQRILRRMDQNYLAEKLEIDYRHIRERMRLTRLEAMCKWVGQAGAQAPPSAVRPSTGPSTPRRKRGRSHHRQSLGAGVGPLGPP